MKISIFDYMDVRLFLQDFYNERKGENIKFSYAIWAEKLGFSNKTILRLIVQGKRSISEKSRNSFLDYFDFTPLERDYFDALIEYSQAKSAPKKQAMGKRLIGLNRLNVEQRILDPESGILKDVYGPIIVMIVSSSNEALDSATIAHFAGLNSERAEEILNNLVGCGLVRKTDNLYSAAQKTFKISDHFGHQALGSYYNYWQKRSAEAIKMPTECRRFRSLQIALSKDEFGEILQRFNDFALSLLSRFEENTLEGRNVYLFNTALFPVAIPDIRNDLVAHADI